MNALNAYINYKVRTNYISLGRGIYVPGSERIILHGGAELKKGHCQSLRPGWSEFNFEFHNLKFFFFFYFVLLMFTIY
jgi:hypothetical protein